MAQYRHVLVGLDLSEESRQVLEQAASIAKAFEAKLSLVHVIEPLTFAYGGDIPMDLSELQDQLQKQATEQLSQFSRKVEVPTAQQHVVIGQPATEMHRLANEQQADVIVVGSHGRHGLALLLGSNSQRGATRCRKPMWLAVRVHTPEE